MSTNFHIRAHRRVQVPTTGNTEVQAIYPDVLQTPSKVTLEIMKSSDILQAYFDHVLASSKDYNEPIYEEGDIFGEKPPVGVRVVNYGKQHVEELKTYLSVLEKEGYEIDFEAW